MSDIATRAPFDFVRYANCWEDAEILVEALEVSGTSRCLSIVSGGDNTLALLASAPELVVGVDINAAELACLDLKRAAIAVLEYPDALAFLGFTPSARRAATYASLRGALGDDARAFWDRNPGLVEHGVIHAGKFERYFAHFRRWVLPLVHTRRTTEKLLHHKTQSERTRFYERTWDTAAWRAVFRVFFSELVMGRMGRDPEFFRYVEGSVSDRILARVRHALTTLPGEDNPYMRYILTGSFGAALPLYMRPESFDRIRASLDRLRVVHGTIDDAERALGVRYDACNLSDIFEYMNDSDFEHVTSELFRVCREGARLAYWNMLVPRSVARRHPARAIRDDELSERLFARDRAFFYQAFHLDRVIAS
jgi:S-adenosylmethionine-diacylglycerol 3-amino-3-carboxypropyl transferase